MRSRRAGSGAPKKWAGPSSARYSISPMPERQSQLISISAPPPPADGRARWIQTRPDAGWFVYFRIYGPEQEAFDGTWKLADFRPT
jgi:hypothetical protein